MLITSHKITKALGLGLSALLLLNGCTSSSNNAHRITIKGSVIENTALVAAKVFITDSTGKEFVATTDANGNYLLTAENISAPLLIAAVANGDPADCTGNDKPRPICLAAVVTAPLAGTATINLNPLTDKAASDVARALELTGAQQLINTKNPTPISAQMLTEANNNVRSGFKDALALSGVKDPANFDPVTYQINSGDKVSHIFSLIHHNRNYDSPTGEAGSTILTDISFRPIVSLTPEGYYEPFDLQRADAEYKHITSAKTRIFLVGDSTSAVYELYRYPRHGWGQKFDEQIKDGATVVVDGSRAGRSSRDFYNGRWFAQMEYLIQPGDYVFINHGHNDQNCDAIKPGRGGIDVKNLCTYPNDAQGNKQFPAGRPEMSFQNSLERYIGIARAKGAIPILFTPTTRIKNAKGEQTTPVVHNHYIKPNSSKDYLFTGDYSQTIKDTAKANQVPLIDLESVSIAFANSVGEPGWRNYWLVVDPVKYPYYANGMGGSTEIPDGTHFQEKGAEVIAQLVAKEIKKNPELKALAEKLK